jgi:hypothetical protein
MRDFQGWKSAFARGDASSAVAADYDLSTKDGWFAVGRE